MKKLRVVGFCRNTTCIKSANRPKKPHAYSTVGTGYPDYGELCYSTTGKLVFRTSDTNTMDCSVCMDLLVWRATWGSSTSILVKKQNRDIHNLESTNRDLNREADKLLWGLECAKTDIWDLKNKIRGLEDRNNILSSLLKISTHSSIASCPSEVSTKDS